MNRIKEWLWKITALRPAMYAGAYLALIPTFAIVFFGLPGVAIRCTSESCGFAQAFYFSTVTITTLGYGDVVPANTYTQIFAAFEALLGVTIIGLFLNSLSHRLSQRAQEVEKEKEASRARTAAVARLRSYDSLVQLRVDRYLLYVSEVTIPLVGRAAARSQANADPLLPGINSEFRFSDMADLYHSTMRMTDDLSKSAVEYYFDSQRDLLSEVEILVRSVELGRWPELESLCLSFIRDCKQLDFSDHIVAARNITTQGGKRLSELHAEIIKTLPESPGYRSSNAMNAFVALYELINKNLAFVRRYRSITSAILLDC